MPILRRLSDADPAALTAALEAIWADGDAAIVLPPDLPSAAMPAAVGAALAGEVTVPDGTALVVPTSGSTGRPRAVVLPHVGLRSAVDASLSRLGCRHGDRWVLALPARHIAGLMVLLRAQAVGTDPVVVDPGDVAAIAAAAGGAEHVAVVPTQLHRALGTEADLSGYRSVLVGGGPAVPDLMTAARSAGIAAVTSYGMTETCGGCVYDGLPLEGTEVATTDDGRIRLRGQSVATHELDGTGLCDSDGWLTTSDLGRLVDGRLEVLGRADDVIVSGGVNIDPVAVARALVTHPAVEDAIVIGVADPTWGSVARAVVVLRDAVDLPSLRDHVGALLGRAQAPRELLIVERIPRDAVGKIPRTVRARLEASPPSGREPD